jgi:4-hydroxybenzoyl-CoA thioesterase
MAFRAHIKVCFSDIDYAGIVYYPRFLHYFHLAMEEFFGAALGMEYPQVLIQHRIGFPTVHLETDFAKPLKYGDELEVEVTIKNVGRSSITWGYKVFRITEPETVIVKGWNVTVTVNLDTFEKLETPDWLKEKLIEHQKLGNPK